jgi:hypothetical protein
MEVLWVYSWLLWIPEYGKWPFGSVHRLPLTIVSLIFLFSTTYFITSILLKQKWRLALIRLIIVAYCLAAIFLVLRIEYTAGYGLLDSQWFNYIGEKIINGFSGLLSLVIALIIGAGICWRGIKWGNSYFDFDDIYRTFLIGLWAQVLLAIVWVISLGTDSMASLASSTGVYVAGYFFFGLSALAMSNLRTIQKKLVAREGAGTVLTRRWLAILFGVIGIMVVFGMVFSAIFSADVWTFLGQSLTSVADWLLQGLEYLLLPFGFIVEGIIYLFKLVVQLIPRGEKYEPGELEQFGPSRFELEKAIPSGLSPAAELAIKWAFIAIILGLLIFLLTIAVRRVMSNRETKHIEQIDESVWTWEIFLNDLRLFFNMLFKRTKHPKIIPVTSRNYIEETEDNLNIREIYQRLLYETSQIKIKRQLYETPYEYAVRFSHTVPEVREYLSDLTDIYVNVRYSNIEAEPKKIDFAKNIWTTLKNLLRKLQDI